jgi:hypothetical protein
MNLLAQADLGGVPASTFKWVFIILIGLIVAASFVWAAFKPERKQSVKFDREDQPLEFRKVAKRYNHELAEERYKELTRRLDKHDEEITEIQKERANALKSINRRFERLLVGITNIGARVGAKIPEDNEGDE